MESSFKVVIEISKNSRLKYEIDKKTGDLVLDRILHGSNVYPHNYGYIEGTLDLDGDPMDVLIISQEVLIPGSKVSVRIVGAMKMIDGGDRDTKFVGVLDVDPRWNEVVDLSDVPQGVLNEIEDFFRNYKLLEGKKVEVNGFVSFSDALIIIEEGKKLYSSRNNG